MDEEADLALLDQHLLRTNLLSQRMTGILSQLDTRLSRLDKTIAPLGLTPLTLKASNIDSALLALNGNSSTSQAQSRSRAEPPKSTKRSSAHSTPNTAASGSSGSKLAPQGYNLAPALSVSPNLRPTHSPTPSFTGSHGGARGLSPIPSAPGSGVATPADETAILTRGPDIMALGEYFTAMDGTVEDLERMYKGFKEGRGGAREAGIRDLGQLVEIGFTGLTQLFLKIARDGMSRSPDLDHLISTGPPTPPNFFPPLNTILPMSTYMINLYSGSKSPGPKTREILSPLYSKWISDLAESRGEWMKRSLQMLINRVEEVDAGGIWEAGRAREKVKGLMGLWDAMSVLVEAETLLITTLFPQSPPPTLLTQTISSPLAMLSTTITPTINTIKRALSSHAFVALDLYQSLVRLSQKWEAIIGKCLSMARSTPNSAEAREMMQIHSGAILSLRSLSLRSFPELLVDIRTPPVSADSPSGGTSSGISDTTHSTLTYLETLPAYEKTVEGLLSSSQSQRSWLMGAKELPSPVKSAEEEGGVVNLFVADVLGTLIIHLSQRAGPMRRPVGQTFLLNNLSHIRNTTSSFNSDIIGPGAEDMLNKAFRDAKAQYLQEWQSLVNILSSQHHQSSTAQRFVPGISGSSSERNQLKDAATGFFDHLAEMESVCGQFPLSRQDPDLRDRIGKEVEDMVVKGYMAFIAKCQGKNVEKYLRGSPEDVGRRIQGVFR